MDIEIRPITPGRGDQFSAVMMAAFGETFTAEEMADHDRWFEYDRSIGAFDGDRLVGIASLYREGRDGPVNPVKGPLGPGWRLRGMATDDAVRGAGFGGALLAACIEHVAAAGGGELWCNARMVAVGFYRRAGFEIVSDEFDVPGIGAHVVMARAVPAG